MFWGVTVTVIVRKDVYMSVCVSDSEWLPRYGSLYLKIKVIVNGNKATKLRTVYFNF
jgi:hypothetical protein